MFIVVDIMNTKKRCVHVMSSGNALYETYKAVMKKNYDIDEVWIFDDQSILKQQKSEKRDEIERSISDTEKLCEEIGQRFIRIKLKELSITTVMDRFTDEYLKNPNCRFMFNITPGRKPLSICLFYVSVWVGGTAYYIEEGGSGATMEFERPIVDPATIRAEKNPNYQTILSYLSEAENQTRSRSDIGIFMGVGGDGAYVPVRGEKKEKRSVTPAMITAWIKRLEEWKLVIREERDGRSKNVRLTPEGRFMANFLKGQK